MVVNPVNPARKNSRRPKLPDFTAGLGPAQTVWGSLPNMFINHYIGILTASQFKKALDSMRSIVQSLASSTDALF
jgi:hypothetical protein